MTNGTTHRSSVTLCSELDQSFVDGVTWPVDDASLAALTDMGLSPRQIAYYFSVTPAEVVRQLRAANIKTFRH
jgi:hypothetical protein